MLNLVKELLADGVPIDGVGFQCHFIVGEVPTSFQSVLEQFTALGIEVAITELDIRMTLPETDALLAQQQKDYQSVVQACMNVENCVGITIWDWTDKVGLRSRIFGFPALPNSDALPGNIIDLYFSSVLVGSEHLLGPGRCLPVGPGTPSL